MTGTEIFTLVARLTCDRTDFNQALADARGQAKSFDGDIDATIGVTDNYSGALGAAESKASSADLDAKGNLSANDQYSGNLSTAEGNAEDAELDADGELSADDQYSGNLEGAETDASNADLDADGELTADDSYSGDLSTAESNASSAELDASGEVTAETTGYNTALDAAETKAETFEGHFREIMSRAATALTAAGIVAGIKAISTEFQKMIGNTANYADQVDKGSRRLMLSTTAYQEWDHVLSQSGASIDDISRGILNLNDAIAATSVDELGEDMQEAFSAIGINPDQYTSTEALFKDVVYALADMDDLTARAKAVTTIFGRNGYALNAMLDSGSEGIGDLIDEAHNLGVIMSGEDIANGVAYGDAVANMNAAVEALKQNIVSGLFPLLTDAANAIAGIIATFNGRTQLKTYDEVKGIWEDMGEALEDVDSEVGGAKGLAKQLWDLSTPAGKVAGDFNLWQRTAKKLIDDVPELSKYINLQTGEITASKDELDGLIDSWGNYRKVQLINAAVGSMDEKVTEVFSRLLDAQVDVGVKKGELDVARGKAVSKAEELMDSLGMSEEDRKAYDLSSYMGLYDFWMYASQKRGGMTLDQQSVLAEFNSGWEEYDAAETALSDAEQKVSDLTDEYNTAKEAADKYREAAEGLIDELEKIPEDVHTTIHMYTDTTGGRPLAGFQLMEHAKGLNYVPYDGYLAELHRGEVVLNQGQSRNYLDDGIDTESIAAAVANAVREGMSGMGINMDGQSVGNIVAETVSRNIATQLRGSRYV